MSDTGPLTHAEIRSEYALCVAMLTRCIRDQALKSLSYPPMPKEGVNRRAQKMSKWRRKELERDMAREWFRRCGFEGPHEFGMMWEGVRIFSRNEGMSQDPKAFVDKLEELWKMCDEDHAKARKIRAKLLSTEGEPQNHGPIKVISDV
jgi:hypothetical protein